MHSADGGLAEVIRSRIRTGGPLTFAAFMQAALHHPTHGYYSRARMTTGAAGDYLTSPDLTPAFGRLIASQVREIARRTSGPGDAFTLIEMGPGTGRMAADMAGAIAGDDPDLAARTSFLMVETSPSLKAAQQERLAACEAARSFADVAWKSWEDVLEGRQEGSVFHGCVVGNEFLDALPVHVVEKVNGLLVEVHVVDHDGGFGETLLAPSTPRLVGRLADLGIELAEGQRAEIGLASEDWVLSLRRLFGENGRGGAILIDYGHQARELYGPSRFRGSLMCYSRHRASGAEGSPYRQVGHQDITAHVDLTTLDRAARRAGFDVAPPVSQMSFLVALGLPEMMADLSRRPDFGGAETTRERLALQALISPEGMGEIFKVVLMTRGVPASVLSGSRDPFRPARGEAVA